MRTTSGTKTGNEGVSDVTGGRDGGRRHCRVVWGGSHLKRLEDDKAFRLYGDTVRARFRKRQLERKFSMDRKPALLASKKLILLLVVTEILIVSTSGLFFYWLKVVQRTSFRYMDVVQGVSGRDENEQSFPHAGSNTDKVFLHVTIFVVVFVLIMPHRTIVPILCSDSLRCDRITLIVFGIKLVASSLYVAGWMQIGSGVTLTGEPSSSDFQTHRFFGKGSGVVFFAYMSVTAIQMMAFFAPGIFRLRLVGNLLRVTVLEWFIDAIEFLTNGTGFLSFLTGMTIYLLNISRESKSHPEEEHTTLTAGWLIRLILLFLTSLHVFTILISFQMHYINDHQHVLTIDEFRDNFLQFEGIYKRTGIENGRSQKVMPRVTSALRVV